MYRLTSRINLRNLTNRKTHNNKSPNKKQDQGTNKQDLDSSAFDILRSKRKRDKSEEFDTILTNDQMALFSTKQEKQHRSKYKTKDDFR